MKNRLNVKIISVLLSVTLLAVLLLSACGESGKYATQKNFITIGCVCPLTGVLAEYGEGTLETEEAAVEAINEDGGLYIDTLQRKLKVRFVVADSKSTQEGAMEAATSLIKDENVDLVICSSGNMTILSTAQICEAEHVPFFAVGCENDTWLANGPFTCSFNFAPDNTSKVKALYDLWMENDISSVGILTTSKTRSKAFADCLSEYCMETDVYVDDPIGVNSEDRYIQRAVRKLDREATEAVICCMDTATFSRIWEEGSIKKLDLSMCILMTDPLFPQDIASIERGVDIKEFYTLTSWDKKYPMKSSLTGEDGSVLGLWWEDRFLSSSSELAGFKHTSVEIAVAAVKLAMALDADTVISAARSLNESTIMGVVDFDDQGSCVIPCSVLKWTFDTATVSWVKELASHSQLTDVEFDDEE